MKPGQLSVLFFCCLASAGLALLGGRLILAPAAAPTLLPCPSPAPCPSRSAERPTFTEAVQRVTPAVVFLRSYPASVSRIEPSTRYTTTGSGVIIDSAGWIATNKHVIADAVRIEVMLGDKREYAARVMGVDEATDLALLKISPDGALPALGFGNSDSLEVGEWVLAIGNPFSLNSTVTAGIVSGKGRSIDVLAPEDRIESFIQTDAAVNPGNSGGALVNERGELVGINTAILSESGQSEGFAFAIPGNLARRVLHDLRAFGEVRRAVLGAYVRSLSARQAKALNMVNAQGVLVTGMRRGSPALRAGLAVDDVITAIDGVAIASPAVLQEQLSRYRPGQRVRVQYFRKGRKRSVSVLLRDRDNRLRHLARGAVYW